jgi:pimeloyl-ACP methyl ester carboxylesterase
MSLRAASIEYDIVQRPAGLPENFAATAGATLQFLAINAIDGYQVDAALWQPEGKAAAETTLVLQVHGSGSNYWKPPNGFLGPALALAGRAVLAINTRQHDDKVATENFFDIRRDLSAAIHTGRALGYRRIVLQGHNLGSLHVLYYAATNWDRDIKAVSLLGMLGNLPWKTRTILVQDEHQFKALTEEAMAALRAGREGERLALPMGWFTGEKMPVTAQHFLTYRCEESSAADSTYWIRRVTHPVLMVRSEADALIQPFEPYMLLHAAHAECSLVASIEYVLLPDPRPRSLEGHSFTGNEAALVATINRWLDAQGL